MTAHEKQERCPLCKRKVTSYVGNCIGYHIDCTTDESYYYHEHPKCNRKWKQVVLVPAKIGIEEIKQ